MGGDAKQLSPSDKLSSASRWKSGPERRLSTPVEIWTESAEDFAGLQRGLHCWNGKSRLQVLKATLLDERLLRLAEEIAGAVGGVRLHGTPEAIVAAEEVLAAVGACLLDTEIGEEDALVNLTTARSRFVEVIRHEAGLDPPKKA